MRDWLTAFLADPMVAAIAPVIVLSLATFVLTVYRAAQDGTFDKSKLPKILDTLVVRRVLPLSILGIAAIATTVGPYQDALVALYLGACTLVSGVELLQLKDALVNAGLPELPMTDAPSL
jgi:hypothetical protein